MRFISKHSNYRVVLKPGVPGNRFLGTEAVPGIYVKFEDGVAEVDDEKMIEQMKKFPGFGANFIIAEGGDDPYADTRRSTEPEHNIGEIKFGTVVGNPNPKPLVTITAEHKKIIREQAKKMLLEIAKDPKQMAEIQKLAEAEKKKEEKATEKNDKANDNKIESNEPTNNNSSSGGASTNSTGNSGDKTTNE